MSSIKNELNKILAIGLPIMGTQVAQAGMGFVDTVMAGRFEPADLAGVALGSSIWIAVFIFFGGILMAMTPIVAHMIGRHQPTRISNQLIQGLWLSLVLGFLGGLVLLSLDPFLTLFNVDEAIKSITLEYAIGLAIGFPAMMGFQVMRSGFEGIADTKSILIIVLLGLVINIPLNYIFMYGKLGLPEMGGAGCGYATAIVFWFTFVLTLIHWWKNRLNTYHQGEFHIKPRISAWLETLKIGVPNALTLFMEVSMFSVIAVLIAHLGAIEVAGHQVTLNLTGLVFMIPLSIGLSLSVRVGQLAGSKQMEQAYFAAKTGIGLCLVFATCSALTITLLNREIASVYTDNLPVIELASSLMLLAALFQFSDGIQVCCTGALRGYKDTLWPMVLTLIAYWIIGLPLGYILGLTDLLGEPMGARGFWYGIIAGLTAAAILLIFRLRQHHPMRKRNN